MKEAYYKDVIKQLCSDIRWDATGMQMENGSDCPFVQSREIPLGCRNADGE